MTPDLDIYRAATVIMKQYSEDARVHAAMRASEMIEAGDLDAHAVWKRILKAIHELQRAEPKSGEAVH